MLLVRVVTCGLAFPDILVVEGKHMMSREPPFSPASEIAGEVVAVGEGAEDEFAVGNRVFGNALSGGLAPFAIMSATSAFKIPDGVSTSIAAGLELNYGTVYHGLKDLCRLKSGEKLLVLGASGGVGMAAVDIGQALGAEVIACASTSAKLAACREAGASSCINYVTAGDGDFKAALKQAGVYGDIDVVLDPVGGRWSEPSMRALGWGGRFLVVGFASGGATPKAAIPKIPLNLALLNEREVIGCFWGMWKARNPQANRRNIEEVLELVRSGRLRPLVSQTYPVGKFREAFEAMMTRKVLGKINIQIGQDVPGKAKL